MKWEGAAPRLLEFANMWTWAATCQRRDGDQRANERELELSRLRADADEKTRLHANGDGDGTC